MKFLTMSPMITMFTLDPFPLKRNERWLICGLKKFERESHHWQHHDAGLESSARDGLPRQQWPLDIGKQKMGVGFGQRSFVALPGSYSVHSNGCATL
jgi:hypothetical protein